MNNGVRLFALPENDVSLIVDMRYADNFVNAFDLPVIDISSPLRDKPLGFAFRRA